MPDFAEEGIISLNGTCSFMEYEWREALELLLSDLDLRRSCGKASYIAWDRIILQVEAGNPHFTTLVKRDAEQTLGREEHKKLDPGIGRVGYLSNIESVRKLLELFSQEKAGPQFIEISFPLARNGAPAFVTMIRGKSLEGIRFAWCLTPST